MGIIGTAISILLALIYLVNAQNDCGTFEIVVDDPINFLAKLDDVYICEANLQMQARWNYITNVTDANAQKQIDANLAFQNFQYTVWTNLSKFDWGSLNDPEKREFQFLNILGPGALRDDDLKKFNQLAADMETTYSTAKICPYQPSKADCNLALDPELTDIMANSDNYDELQHVWVEWHKAAGKPIRQNYTDFVALNNKAAYLSGYDNMGSLWNAYYLYDGCNEECFKGDIENIWQEVKPLYIELYTYVRRMLSTTVHKGRIQRYGLLPAHVLGNMWAQTWGNIARHVLPFPEEDPIDVTPALQQHDVQWMFKTSEKFFTDLGFEPMTDIFWSKTQFERPNDGREVVCHASAEEFYYDATSPTKERTDFRIKMCTSKTQEDFITIHHEMGHIAYFMEYRDNHWVFRNGANPGFHEAIGDCLALAVSTPIHLENLDLLNKTKQTESKLSPKDIPEPPSGTSRRDLNFLLTQALEKIAFLPFGYLMDKWRWAVFSNEVTPEQMNSYWWELRKELQGIVPPVNRTEDDFDPGAKYHIPANVEYIRYFVSFIVQFQFYESMCLAAGAYDPNDPNKPLYKCDFNGSIDAGTKLRNMMQLGFSKPWPEAMSAIADTDRMSASSLLKYFQPLHDWLKLANEGDCKGWEDLCESHAAEYMETTYEKESSDICNKAVLASWNYQTNITDYNAEQSTNWTIQAANYRKESWTNYITQYEWDKFNDSSLKRQFQLLDVLGTAALSDADLTQLNNEINTMSDLFAVTKICPFDKQDCDLSKEGLNLEPDLEDILVNSKNYDELSYVWEEWRNKAARPMREHYIQYVNLSNKAARANGFKDMSEMWKAPYETPGFQQELEAILKETKPLYELIHAYARKKLREKFQANSNEFAGKSPIPASILGNMWAQTWENIYDLLVPFPDAAIVDVTEEMKKQNYTPTKMFELSEDFYVSLGLAEMPTTYNTSLSMIERPNDRNVVCHASAWDFCNGVDFRIKMCTEVNMVDLITIHHELGHIQYYIQYKEQPITFRDGANPGFHEAIGDVMALSVQTPGHMKKVGLLPDYMQSKESDLNFLMRSALEKVTFLPFAYVMDRWRWGVFSGEFSEKVDWSVDVNNTWMYNWLKLRNEYQGLIPPVMRSIDDFDPGAKYHIAADVEYSRYFVAHVLQFQIHKALCIKAEEYDPIDADKPLYRCDIYNSTKAGQLLGELLKAGSSKPWREILMETIGEDSMNASAILEYFAPLMQYLKDNVDPAELGWDMRFEEFIKNENTPTDNTVPIIVGIVLGVLVVVVIIAYFVGRHRSAKKAKKKSKTNRKDSDPEQPDESVVPSSNRQDSPKDQPKSSSPQQHSVVEDKTTAPPVQQPPVQVHTEPIIKSRTVDETEPSLPKDSQRSSHDEDINPPGKIEPDSPSRRSSSVKEVEPSREDDSKRHEQHHSSVVEPTHDPILPSSRRSSRHEDPLPVPEEHPPKKEDERKRSQDDVHPSAEQDTKTHGDSSRRPSLDEQQHQHEHDEHPDSSKKDDHHPLPEGERKRSQDDVHPLAEQATKTHGDSSRRPSQDEQQQQQHPVSSQKDDVQPNKEKTSSDREQSESDRRSSQ